MATTTELNSVYSLLQGVSNLFPEPKKMRRDPTIVDFGQVGQEWINIVTAIPFILCRVANGAATWVQQGGGGGAGVFTSLTTTTGPVTLTSTQNAAQSIYLHANGGAAETVEIFSQQGTGANSVNIHSAAGGIEVNANNNLALAAATGDISLTANTTLTLSTALSAGDIVLVADTAAPVASPTATAAVPGNVGVARFTGFTTASGVSQDFIITNASITVTSGIILTVSNTGGQDAQMTIYRVEPFAGSVTVTLFNNGAAALNGDVIISFILLG